MDQMSKENNQINLDINLVKTLMPDATQNDLNHFMYLCIEYNLNPLKKEIYAIRHGNKYIAVTSRDGYLKIANLNPDFDGLESDVVYQGDKLVKNENGSITMEYGEPHMMFDKSKLSGAYCSVFRKDRSKATTVFVSIKDYYKKSAPIWEQYTNAMILKVAEAMALKRAFSISGLSSKEELDNE